MAKVKAPASEDGQESGDDQNIATSLRSSQGSDGSRTPKVPGQGGAPPSADNNV